MPRDSLDIVEFFMDLERQFDTEILDESIERIRPTADITVGRIYELLTGAPSLPATNDPRWRRLVAIVARYMGMPVDDVTSDTRPFV